jgi:hypothetical protein
VESIQVKDYKLVYKKGLSQEMSAMLRCPACNEIITANSAECKYCSLPLNYNIISTEVIKFEKVSKAVTEANTIRSFNAALILVGLACIYLLVSGGSGLRRAYIHFLPLAGLIWVISWFVRYGSLQSKDPDFEPARAQVKRSLLMWSIGFVIYIICVIWALVGRSM